MIPSGHWVSGHEVEPSGCHQSLWCDGHGCTTDWPTRLGNQKAGDADEWDANLCHSPEKTRLFDSQGFRVRKRRVIAD